MPCNGSCRAVLGALFLLATLCVASTPARAANDVCETCGDHAPLRILAGTSIAADIVSDLCGPAAAVRLLIPGGACPGHYDLRPGDLRFLGGAQLLVLESFQSEMPNMRDLIRAARNEQLQIFVLPEAESAMLPEAQERLTLALAKELARLRPELASRLERATAERIARVREVAGEQRARLEKAGTPGTVALSSALQASFARWAGLDVAATYGRPEDLTPERFGELQDIGAKRGARLVLDNVQSGPGAGRGLAETLGAGRAELTSFPGGFPDAPEGREDNDGRWESAFIANVNRVLAALGGAGS
ncbi:metal ABC transporter substrate-binding protein [Paucidesulfovibrio longus]|uniref:metal ABC transporter substrate-binding protein n=1 Tax=Paucidesulfovibrio longus TaxID=889 RepID=UPI0003B79B1C|nr:zinc ABC transporter substrate-binding protein [Paucidesulfovibrio longus]